MQIDVRANVKQFKKNLKNTEKKQVPFATSRALNKTGQLVLVGLSRAAQKTFKGGATGATMRALAPPKGLSGKRHNISFSTKKHLTTSIFIPPWAAKYLKYQIDGGIRQTVGKGTGVPYIHKKLDRFGNISGRKKGLIKGKKQFIATIKGIDGVWERYGKGGKGVRLLIAFEKNPNYKYPKFKYYSTAQKITKLHFPKKMKLELAHAIRTAK